MVEATESNAHGKGGTAIAPLAAPPEPKDRSTTVAFNNAPGPVPDATDRAHSQTAEYEGPYSPESQRGSPPADVVDLTRNIPLASFQAMEKDLFSHMAKLHSGAERLTDVLDARLQALISTMYSDDVDEGGKQMSKLSEFRARDRHTEQPRQVSHPQEDSNKRAGTQVVSALEKSGIGQASENQPPGTCRGTI